MADTFYTPASPGATLQRVDADVYGSRYQREKDRCIERLLRHVPLANARVLEVGCGAGVWTERLLAMGARVTAVDLRPHLVEAARERLRRGGATGRCVLLAGELARVVPPEPAFDLAFLKDVIEHVAEDAALIEEVSRRVTPEGKLFVATQNACSLNFCWEGFWERCVKRNRLWMGWDETHVRFYTPRRLRRLLAPRGWSIAHRNAAYFLPYRWLTCRIGLSSFEPSCFHWLDRLSDDNWFAGLGWSVHVLCGRAACR